MELFRWLRDVKGVYGKGIKVYRPEVEVGDKTFILQRMTEDNRSGMIMFSNNEFNPMTGHPVHLWPKGMKADVEYTLECLEGGMPTTTRTGAEWMRDGITLERLNPGEYILINLPGRPGQGTDTVAPTTPASAAKAADRWLNRDGVALSWEAATDDVFLSHYEVWQGEQLLTRVSTGTFCFLPDADLAADYRIRAVDGDGNKSGFVTAK